MKKLGALSLMTLVLTVLSDVLSKRWIEQLAPREVSIAGQFLKLNLNYNTGVAFGLFQNMGLLPIIVTGCIVVIAIGFIRGILKHTVPILVGIPVALILGGAIANLIDRLMDGRVTDFLDIGLGTLRWPTFNLADCFIVVGVALLLLMPLSRKTTADHSQLSMSDNVN